MIANLFELNLGKYCAKCLTDIFSCIITKSLQGQCYSVFILQMRD